MLLLAAFSLFRTDFWRDQVYPPYQLRPAIELSTSIGQMQPGEPLRLLVEVEDDNGLPSSREMVMTIPDTRPADRLKKLGFVTQANGDALTIVDIGFMSPAENAGLEPGFATSITGYQLTQEQPAKAWFALPSIFLAILLGLWQRRRKAKASL